jgi:cephalosporin hydroxylase
VFTNVNGYEQNLRAKALSQGGIMTFYDGLIYEVIFNDHSYSGHILQLDDFLKESKANRFCSYEDRIKRTNNESSLLPHDLLMSQGTHSLISWKGLSLYKTAYDLVIYSMLISELQPNIIVEYGSGSGGSAVWMSDMAMAHGLDTKVFSYDLKKPTYKNINNAIDFIECDLTHKMECDWGKGRKMVIEDVHVNIVELLLQTDRHLESGDYLIVEDSVPIENQTLGTEKQKAIAEFIANATNTYEVDQYYSDFFGKNVGCCADSIFRVV